MRKVAETILKIPEGISCDFSEGVLICKSESGELKKEISSPRIDISVKGDELKLGCKDANKNDRRNIATYEALIKNVFQGLKEKYVYKLQSANVHFPMTLKKEGNKVLISNFLGEKIPRVAMVQDNVEVEIKGNDITVSSPDKIKAGQTASNLEKATKVKGRDRRIFQDGIYITEKPARRMK